jgi:hypothetical protein
MVEGLVLTCAIISIYMKFLKGMYLLYIPFF